MTKPSQAVQYGVPVQIHEHGPFAGVRNQAQLEKDLRALPDDRVARGFQKGQKTSKLCPGRFVKVPGTSHVRTPETSFHPKTGFGRG